MSWQNVYAQLGITPEDERLYKLMLIHEREVKVCTLAEASDLVEFEQSNPRHCHAMKTIVDWAEAGHIPTPDDLLSLHAELFPYGGYYRTCDVYIKGSSFVPPRYDHIPMLMKNWYHDMLWWLSSREDPYTILAEVHLKLTQIHPYSDGNGRIARMVLNHNATYLNRPFILISQRNRNTYLDCLENENVPALARLFRNLSF